MLHSRTLRTLRPRQRNPAHSEDSIVPRPLFTCTTRALKRTLTSTTVTIPCLQPPIATHSPAWHSNALSATRSVTYHCITNPHLPHLSSLSALWDQQQACSGVLAKGAISCFQYLRVSCTLTALDRAFILNIHLFLNYSLQHFILLSSHIFVFLHHRFYQRILAIYYAAASLYLGFSRLDCTMHSLHCTHTPLSIPLQFLRSTRNHDVDKRHECIERFAISRGKFELFRPRVAVTPNIMGLTLVLLVLSIKAYRRRQVLLPFAHFRPLRKEYFAEVKA